MSSFVLLSAKQYISETVIKNLQSTILDVSQIIPRRTRVIRHRSKHLVFVELCAFETAVNGVGEDSSVEAMTFFDGVSWRDSDADFISLSECKVIDPNYLHGTFSLTEIDEAGKATVHYDPLCGHQVFYATGNGLAVISDRASICAALTGNNSFDEIFYTWMAVIGHGVGGRTRFNGVLRAPVGGHISVDNGTISVKSSASTFPKQQDALPQILEAYAQQIVKAYVLLYKNVGRFRFGLTGGKDSRLALAMLMKADLHRKVDFFVWDVATDKGGSADSLVAQHIANKFDLTFEVVPRPSAEAPALPLEALLRRIRAHTFITDGHLGAADLVALAKPSREMTCSGLYGELLKTFYKGTRPNSPGYDAEAIYATGLDRFSAFKPGTAKLLEDEIFGATHPFVPPEASARDYADGHYIVSRMPNWAGNRSNRRFSNLLLTPLYNRYLLKIPFSLSPGDRKSHKAHHDLIAAESEVLASVPFAADQWPKSSAFRSAPIKNPTGIPMGSNWKAAVMRSPDHRKAIANLLLGSSAGWTRYISKEIVAEKLLAEDDGLPRSLSGPILGMLTATISEDEKPMGPKMKCE